MDKPDPPVKNEIQQRRALERAVAAMATTTNELELLEAINDILDGWPPDLILRVLVKSLGTPSSQERGGLARLALLLPRDETIAALQQVAANRAAAPDARVTAAMVLERFLKRPPSPGVLADLQNEQGAAEQSLREAVVEGRTNRLVLLEYVSQMQEHGVQIAMQVMAALDRFGPADQVELLRLMAQESRAQVSNAAQQRLEVLAETEDSALRALHTLQFCLPPAQAKTVERSLRKLQFRGRVYTPPPSTGWRAFTTFMDHPGWLRLRVVDSPEGATAGFEGECTLHPDLGIMEVWSDDAAEQEYMPMPPAPGKIVYMLDPDTGDTTWLESSMDLPVALAQMALKSHWSGSAQRPLLNEWRLLTDRLFQFAPARLDPDIEALFNRPSDAAPVSEAKALITRLYKEKVLREWLPPNPLTNRYAKMLPSGVTLKQMTTLILRGLVETGEGESLQQALEADLWMKAIWLRCSGNSEAADVAWRLAYSMRVWPLEQNPMAFALIAESVKQLESRAH